MNCISFNYIDNLVWMNWMRQRILILLSPFHSIPFFFCNCHGESCLFELGAEAIYNLKLVWCGSVKNYEIHFVTSLLCFYEPHKITVYQRPMYAYINLIIWVFWLLWIGHSTYMFFQLEFSPFAWSKEWFYLVSTISNSNKSRWYAQSIQLLFTWRI